MIIASLVNFEQLLPIAVFGVFALGAWWLLDMMAGGKSRSVQRLEELKNPMVRKRDERDSAAKKGDAMTRVLEQAAPALARPLQPKSEIEASKLKTRLANAGWVTMNVYEAAQLPTVLEWTRKSIGLIGKQRARGGNGEGD